MVDQIKLQRVLYPLTGLLLLLVGSRLQSAYANRQLAAEPALIQQTVLIHCRHQLAPELARSSRERYAARFEGCADFTIQATAVHGGLLGAMMLKVQVRAGDAFPLPARAFVFKAGPLTDKGLLAFGAVSAGQLRFNPAITYSEETFRSSF